MSRYHVYTDARHSDGSLAGGHDLTIYTTQTEDDLATLYAAETGATTLANPYEIPSTGIVEFWTEDANPWVLAEGDTVRRPLHINISGGEVSSVKDYGAAGDGVTDDTIAIQAAIDAVALTGGTLTLPPGNYIVSDSLVPKSKVTLLGSCYSSSTSTGYTPPVRITGDGGFPIFDSGSATVKDFALDGIALLGSQSESGSMGIYAEDADNWSLRNLFLDSFANQGAYIRGGVAGTYENIWVQNAFMKHEDASTFVGAFQLGDATHWVSDLYCRNVVATCSISTSTGNYLHSGYLCGIYAGATNSVFQFCVGHISETGIYVPSSQSDLSNFQNCRADLNQGHGFWVAGGSATFIGCTSYRNSRDTDATYHGFNITFGGNTFVGCRVEQHSSDTVCQLDAFHDTAQTRANTYIGNRKGTLVTGDLYDVSGAAADSVDVAGDRSDGTALANLLTALAAQGIITDSTTA